MYVFFIVLLFLLTCYFSVRTLDIAKNAKIFTSAGLFGNFISGSPFVRGGPPSTATVVWTVFHPSFFSKPKPCWPHMFLWSWLRRWLPKCRLSFLLQGINKFEHDSCFRFLLKRLWYSVCLWYRYLAFSKYHIARTYIVQLLYTLAFLYTCISSYLCDNSKPKLLCPARTWRDCDIDGAFSSTVVISISMTVY